MMCTTVLHGGVCHRTSTPHKSGTKKKEKKISYKSDTLMISPQWVYRLVIIIIVKTAVALIGAGD